MPTKKKKPAAKKASTKAGSRKAKPGSRAHIQPDAVSEWDAFDLSAASNWNLRNKQQEYKDELDGVAESIVKGKVKDTILSKGRQRQEGDNKNSEQGDARILVDFRNFLKAKVITALAADTSEPQYDEEWVAQRFLGCGAFGSVALWVKRDKDAVEVDHLAIKQADPQRVDLWDLHAAEKTDVSILEEPLLLAREAVLQSHLNGSNIENLVHLRSFKTIDTREPATVQEEAPKWKFYLEYAPHGELARVIELYRAWNKYLPELFLWHVFDSLAVALKAMADHQPVAKKIPHRRKLMPTKSSTVVHFDIKPDNIFLGQENPRHKPEGTSYGGIAKYNSLKAMYPMIKVADFGISEFVGKPNDENPGSFFRFMGTDWYKAPEIVSYGITWREPPNGKKLDKLVDGLANGDPVLQDEQGRLIDWINEHEKRGKNSGIVIGQETNVWNIGKVMFDLATLNRKWTYDDISAKSFRKYTEFGENAIQDFVDTPFSVDNKKAGATSPYSNKLLELIQQCLRPKMVDRVTPSDLIAATSEGLREQVSTIFGEDAAQDGAVPSSRSDAGETSATNKDGSLNTADDQAQILSNSEVHYKGYSINKMQAGEEEFERIDPEHIRQPPDGFNWRAKEADICSLLTLDADPDESWGKLTLPAHWEKTSKHYNAYAKKKKLQSLEATFQSQQTQTQEGSGSAPPTAAPSVPRQGAKTGTRTNTGKRKQQVDADAPPPKKTKKNPTKKDKKTPAAKSKATKKQKLPVTDDSDFDADQNENVPPSRSTRSRTKNQSSS